MHTPLTRRLTTSYALPIDLEKLKMHLKVDGTDEDGYLTDLAIAAGALWEERVRQAVMQAEYITGFSGWGRLWLRGPVSTVTKIEYYDQQGGYSQLDPTLYELSGLYANSVTVPEYWTGLLPAISYATKINEGVLVYYTAGAASVDDVPPLVQQFIRLMVGHWYENRQEVIAGTSGLQQIPLGAQALIDLEREPVL